MQVTFNDQQFNWTITLLRGTCECLLTRECWMNKTITGCRLQVTVTCARFNSESWSIDGNASKNDNIYRLTFILCNLSSMRDGSKHHQVQSMPATIATGAPGGGGEREERREGCKVTAKWVFVRCTFTLNVPLYNLVQLCNNTSCVKVAFFCLSFYFILPFARQSKVKKKRKGMGEVALFFFLLLLSFLHPSNDHCTVEIEIAAWNK